MRVEPEACPFMTGAIKLASHKTAARAAEMVATSRSRWCGEEGLGGVNR
jgi:hypothetical protein